MHDCVRIRHPTAAHNDTSRSNKRLICSVAVKILPLENRDPTSWSTVLVSRRHRRAELRRVTLTGTGAAQVISVPVFIHSVQQFRSP